MSPTVWAPPRLHLAIGRAYAKPSTEGRLHYVSALLRILDLEQSEGAMFASLIGRLGSSTFRLSTTAVSMSLTGSCFSSESTPRPFHYGIRGRGGTIFGSALPADERQVQADMRTHLTHRPARDIIPPLGGARVFSYYI